MHHSRWNVHVIGGIGSAVSGGNMEEKWGQKLQIS